MMLMSYGNVFVTQVAMGASHAQTVRAIIEAEKYPGPSIVIAYSHCIAHGIDMSHGLENQKRAVNSGHWILYRFNPQLVEEGKNPLQLDSKPPSIDYAEYAYNETRFRTLKGKMPERAEHLLKLAQRDAIKKYNLYRQMAAIDYSKIYEKSE
jgi:pyruvate-ferredoxin/flavodoxin oxidoreductase